MKKYALWTFCFALVASMISVSRADEKKASGRKNTEATATGSFAPMSEIIELKRQLSEQQKRLSEQQKEIEELRLTMQNQRRAMDVPPEPGGPEARHSSSDVPTPSGPPAVVAAPTSMTATPSVVASEPKLVPAKSLEQSSREYVPLSFHLGSAYITPVGFMDFTSVWRSTSPGSGIGTNFGSIPYGNTTQGKLSELRMSAQNSRVGARVDAIVKGAHVIGYWESDFLGFVPSNAAVSSNSDSFRLRLYWVDVSKDKWEILGGQSWSLMTPGRKGISPLPGDLSYTQDIDVNYQAGLTWSRDPQLRFVFHPSSSVAMGVSLESPEQYIGGSAGGSLVTLPAALASIYAQQVDNGGTTLSVPGLHPDIVAKIAFDPRLGGRDLHFEIGATARSFKVWNPLANEHFTSRGVGGQANISLELAKGFRVLTNNYWSDGGGRWIFGQAPDLIVRSDGSLSPVHSFSTVSGFEYGRRNTLLYSYYGGVYIGRNFTTDTATGRFVGYGYPGSSNSQNRSIQQATFGFTQTFWKDSKYGALSLMGQYSYMVRNPWSTSPGEPRNARLNMIFLNLRYALPGSAPAVEQ